MSREAGKETLSWASAYQADAFATSGLARHGTADAWGGCLLGTLQLLVHEDMVMIDSTADAVPARSVAACVARDAATVLVRVTGFRTRSGQVRVRLFGDPTSSYFDKRRALVRVEYAVPATGRVDVCVVAPRPGVYAVDVRHDENNNGKTDRQDGGGVSGNPRVSLFDMLFGRKPAPGTVQFRVGTGTTVVPITLMYLQGGSFRPIRDAE